MDPGWLEKEHIVDLWMPQGPQNLWTLSGVRRGLFDCLAVGLGFKDTWHHTNPLAD